MISRGYGFLDTSHAGNQGSIPCGTTKMNKKGVDLKVELLFLF